MLDEMTAWHDRHQERFEAFGTFVGGGGFAVVDVPDEQTLNQMVLENPFAPFSNIDVRPYLAGAAGLQQAKEAFAAMAASS